MQQQAHVQQGSAALGHSGVACLTLLVCGQDNKCSWLVVQALERASPAQRSSIKVCPTAASAVLPSSCLPDRPASADTLQTQSWRLWGSAPWQA